MKSKLTLLFVFFSSLSSLSLAQYVGHSPSFGVGVGYNFVSIVAKDVRPVELSFRYQIDRNNLLQLFVPILKQDDVFKSRDIIDMELVNSSLDMKKRLYGIGIDYDYALHTFASLDFVVGLRMEYQLYKYRTHLTNRLPNEEAEGIYRSTEITYRDTKSSHYLINPNAGLRLHLHNFSIDAKCMFSLQSKRGDVDNLVKLENTSGETTSTTTEWSEQMSNKFKIKPGLVMSMSYYF